jgi:thiamine transport system ATP-binding protein
MASVSVQAIDKSFGDVPVLRGVGVDVDDGTTLSLLGPSGSGKSTLLRVIAGLEVPDVGRVRIGDVDVSDRPAHRRDVGFVFQDQALFPHLDVGDNVGFGLRMAGTSRGERRARVLETLQLVGLPGFEGRDPATLSGGEAQRVALARALAPRPEVVLLDEPLAALDQLLRERLLLELRDVFDRLGVTVIAVTHDPTEAGALGHRLAVLLDGAIVQTDDPGAVLAAPATSEVAGLVGHRNVVAATVRSGVAECPWGCFPAPASPAGPVFALVPPDAVRPDPDGALTGTVTGRIFRGGSAFAVVSGEGWPPIDVRAEPAWRVGDVVRLSVDRDAVHVMAT